MAPEAGPTPSSWSRTNSQNTVPLKTSTSQHIDKLVSEKEKLVRENKALNLAREDDSRRVAAARSKAEETQAELQRLQVEADANRRALDRKERKMKELEAALETEANRRKLAEQRADEALKMLGDTRSETQRQLAQAYEQKLFAETQLNATKDGYKRITDGREKRLARIVEDVNVIRARGYETADRFKRFELVTDGLRDELPRFNHLKTRLGELLAEYKQEHGKELHQLEEQGASYRSMVEAKERDLAKLEKELLETKDKMKWVMSQQKRQAGL